VRLGPLRGPPGEEGCPARTRADQRTGSTSRTPGSSPDWRGVSRSSGSSNGSRRTRPQKAWGRSGPVSKGRTPLREARLREATRKRRAIRSPGMPRKQKRRGRRVTAGARLERHRKASDQCRPITAGTSPEAHSLHASSLHSFPDEARLFIAASPPVEVTVTSSSLLDFVLRFSLHRIHIIYIS
jgi:hypothetical protein